VYRIFQLQLFVFFTAQYLLGRKVAVSTRVQETLRKFSPKDVRKVAGGSLSQGLDRRTLKWTFDSLRQDPQFEQFFAGLPDFCNSKAVEDPMDHLDELNEGDRLSEALIGLTHRTLTAPGYLISEPARQRRMEICMRSIDAVPNFLLSSSVDSWSAVLRTVGDQRNDPTSYIGLGGKFRVSLLCYRLLTLQVISNKVWDISQPTLQDCLRHDYNVLLANLISITRIIF